MKWLITIAAVLTTQAIYANARTICGSLDDRIESNDPAVARAQQFISPRNAGCTLTMIGKTCAITAGHCKSVLEEAHFNTPPSADGNGTRSKPEDIYEVDASTIVAMNNGIGKDWAVLRLRANNITGKLPGEAQGFYNVAIDAPIAGRGTSLRIVGYGRDSERDKTFSQQINTSIEFYTRGQALYHRVDTMGGNSGSSIINEDTDEVVAIHTHGGCRSSGGYNASTLISARADFKRAIAACLEQDQ